MTATTVYSANLAAYSVSANIFAGDTIEFTPNRVSLVNVYAVASAIGIKLTVMADSDVAVQDKEIAFIGTTLDKSAQLVDSFFVGPGTRLSVFLRESANVATTDVYTCLEVIPR